MNKFILSGFSDEIADDFIEQLKVIKKTKIKHIELRNANKKNVSDHTLAEIQVLKSQLDEYGIKVSCVGSPIGKISIDEDFAPHFEKFKHTVEVAKALDTKYIRLFSFFIDKDKNPQDYQEKVLKQFNMFCNYAKNSGIMLLHENEKGIFGESVDNCKILMDNCDDIAKTIFDPANFVQGKQEIYPYGYNTLKPYIKYLHIKDCVAATDKIVPVGEGDAQVKEVLVALMNDNFEGFLSLEPHLNNGDVSVGGEGFFMIAYNALIKTLDEIGACYN